MKLVLRCTQAALLALTLLVLAATPPGQHTMQRLGLDRSTAIGQTFPGFFPRELLSASRTYFVATTGNDSNSCLSSAQACLTYQHVVNLLVAGVDTGGQAVTISTLNAGAYSPVTVTGPFVGDICNVTLAGDPEVTITGATNATPIVITAVGHTYVNGNHVVISGVGGNTAANGAFLVAGVSGNTFQLTKEVDSSNVAGNGAYTSGGTVSSPRRVTIAASSANQAAINVTNGACLNVHGFSVSSSNGQDITAFYGAQMFLKGKMDFGASGASTSQLYATRSATIERDDACSISGGTYEFQQASHAGQIRHQNSACYLTASLTYNNPVDPNTAFSLAQGQGQIIETGSGVGYNLQGFTVTAQAQFRLFENGNIEANGNTPPASGYYPGTFTGSQQKLGNSTLGPTWWIDTGNGNFWNVAGTGSTSWGVQKSDNSVTLFSVSNAGQVFIPNVLLTTSGSLTLANGLNSNIAPPFQTRLHITGPTGAFSVGGFTGGVDGYRIHLFNTVAQTMTIVNEDASSTAANRITTLTGGNVVLRTTATSFATLSYDGTNQRWILESTN